MKILFPLLLFVFLSAANTVQYCTDKWETSRVSFCVGASSSYDATSQAADVYLTLLASFKSKRGWGAIGVGERMSGALMFVTYPGTIEGDGML